MAPTLPSMSPDIRVDLQIYVLPLHVVRRAARLVRTRMPGGNAAETVATTAPRRPRSTTPTWRSSSGSAAPLHDLRADYTSDFPAAQRDGEGRLLWPSARSTRGQPHSTCTRPASRPPGALARSGVGAATRRCTLHLPGPLAPSVSDITCALSRRLPSSDQRRRLSLCPPDRRLFAASPPWRRLVDACRPTPTTAPSYPRSPLRSRLHGTYASCSSSSPSSGCWRGVTHAASHRIPVRPDGWCWPHRVLPRC